MCVDTARRPDTAPIGSYRCAQLAHSLVTPGRTKVDILPPGWRRLGYGSNRVALALGPVVYKVRYRGSRSPESSLDLRELAMLRWVRSQHDVPQLTAPRATGYQIGSAIVVAMGLVQTAPDGYLEGHAAFPAASTWLSGIGIDDQHEGNLLVDVQDRLVLVDAEL